MDDRIVGADPALVFFGGFPAGEGGLHSEAPGEKDRTEQHDHQPREDSCPDATAGGVPRS